MCRHRAIGGEQHRCRQALPGQVHAARDAAPSLQSRGRQHCQGAVQVKFYHNWLEAVLICNSEKLIKYYIRPDNFEV